MKITVNKEAFINGLQLVHGAVSARPTLPVLSNVLLQAKQKKLWLTATDLEISVRCSIEAEVDKPGATTLPEKRLLSIIRELPADTVNIDVSDGHKAKITSGASYFKIHGLADDDFPPLLELSGGNSYSVDRIALKNMLQKTAYAASTDETRFVLNGNLFSFRNEKLVVVATDGRRLALSEQEVDFPKEAEVDLIVPTKTIVELMKTLTGEGLMKIHVVKNQVAFEIDDTILISKLIEGQYPNFRQVIPASTELRIVVEREMLLTVVRRVALLISDKAYSVKLTFAKNKLTVSASAPEVGEAEESMPIKYNGDEIAIAFNPDYMMDPLKNIESDEVYIELTDETGPGVIKCDGAFLYVLMPVRGN